MAHPVGHKGILSWDIQLYQMPPKLHTQPGAEWLIQNILLIAKSPADIRLNHTNLTPVNAQRLSNHAADDVWDLR